MKGGEPRGVSAREKQGGNEETRDTEKKSRAKEESLLGETRKSGMGAWVEWGISGERNTSDRCVSWVGIGQGRGWRDRGDSFG